MSSDKNSLWKQNKASSASQVPCRDVCLKMLTFFLHIWLDTFNPGTDCGGVMLVDDTFISSLILCLRD